VNRIFSEWLGRVSDGVICRSVLPNTVRSYDGIRQIVFAFSATLPWPHNNEGIIHMICAQCKALRRNGPLLSALSSPSLSHLLITQQNGKGRAFPGIGALGLGSFGLLPAVRSGLIGQQAVACPAEIVGGSKLRPLPVEIEGNRYSVFERQ